MSGVLNWRIDRHRRSDKPSGYAVGIGKPDREIEFYSIEGSKDAAIEYARKHIGLLLQSAH